MTTTTNPRTKTRRPRARLAPSDHGKALYRWLEGEWARMGVSPTPWCRQHGIPDPTVLRWKNGTYPDFRNVERVAEALGRPVLDLLVAGEWVTQEQANGHVPQPIIIDARRAIELDTTLSPVLQEALLQMMDHYGEIEAGIVKSIESRTTGGRRGARTTTKAS